MREALGWSQRDLAERAGVRQATVSQVENGGGVNLTTLEKLADALNVNAATLIIHEPAQKKGGRS